MSPKNVDFGDYSLVICEKPDAARRVAEALSETSPRLSTVGRVQVFQSENIMGRYVICAASGHLYGVSDTIANRRVYPVFDLEWFPLELARRAGPRGGRIHHIRDLAKGARSFVNACDFDLEGETIGYNILRYACMGSERSALRARFSTLTREEVRRAFREARVESDNLAAAGRLRHVVDFMWGVNLSRALGESLRTGYGYRTVSVGRVQGPTLSFVVEREVSIQTFVPMPYWVATGVFRKDDVVFEAPYSVGKLSTQFEASRVRGACEGKTGLVSRVSSTMVRRRPPGPFNLGDLQKESYRLFGYSPRETLRVAETLYLDALISYPRTGSQKLPDLDHRALLEKIGKATKYSGLVGRLPRGRHPSEGAESDSAHPAIYPTGEVPRRRLRLEEERILDVVTRRYVSCFAEDSVDEMVSIIIVVEACEFDWVGRRMVSPGWLTVYGAGGFEDAAVPQLEEGEAVLVEAVKTEEKFSSGPPRYNQSSLLEKMERERIGTKATRADTISVLLERGYVTGESLAPTPLGFALIETMEEYCPEIISVDLTRETERQLESIERGTGSASDLLEEIVESLSTVIERVRSNESDIAGRMLPSIREVSLAKSVLGQCPVCGSGRLRVVRSSRTKKRFAGCTNYPAGCKASAPLPQRGVLRAGKRPCKYCKWPVVYVRIGRRPWRLCINLRCPGKP